MGSFAGRTDEVIVGVNGKGEDVRRLVNAQEFGIESSNFIVVSDNDRQPGARRDAFALKNPTRQRFESRHAGVFDFDLGLE